MTVALILHGLIGSISGKHSQNRGGASEVLQHSYEYNKKFIIDPLAADVYFHSWDIDHRTQLIDLYNPKGCKIERQTDFRIPEYIRARKERVFAHFSRWYSYRSSVGRVTRNYDLYITQRFDLLWNITPNFTFETPNDIYVGKCTLNTNHEWSDRWFAFGTKDSMLKFGELYTQIPTYMGPGGNLQSDKQYGGISSHFLSRHHALQCGLQPKFKYIFGGYGSRINDYNEVRRQIYGNDN